jgi:hypothetical protein
MPNADNSPEATAIEVAYEAQVQAFFKSLITNLGDEPVSPSNRSAMCRQIAGPNIPKRAKQLALNVITRVAYKNCSITKQENQKEIIQAPRFQFPFGRSAPQTF